MDKERWDRLKAASLMALALTEEAPGRRRVSSRVVRTWLHPNPKNCSICNRPIGHVFVFGRLAHTKERTVCCTECHYSMGLGLDDPGTAEAYELNPENRVFMAISKERYKEIR